jgi:hypothetical protein
MRETVEKLEYLRDYYGSQLISPGNLSARWDFENHLWQLVQLAMQAQANIQAKIK